MWLRSSIKRGSGPWPSAPTVRRSLPEAGTKSARLWDAATGMPLGPPIVHPNEVFSVAFSPDGNSFLTGAYDYAARLFRRVPELPDDLERAAAWVEVLTGLALDAGQGTIRVLDNEGWRMRRDATGATGRVARNGGRTEARSHSVWCRPDGPRSWLDGTWSCGTRPRPHSTSSSELEPYNASSWIERQPISHRPRVIAQREPSPTLTLHPIQPRRF